MTNNVLVNTQPLEIFDIPWIRTRNCLKYNLMNNQLCGSHKVVLVLLLLLVVVFYNP